MKTKLVLPPLVLDMALEHARAGRFEHAVVEVYLAFGYDLRDPGCETFKANECAIPKWQWERICEALVGSRQDSIAGANMGMSWVNYGPSAWT